MADTGETGRRFPTEEEAEMLQRMASSDVMAANQDPSLLSSAQHEYVSALQSLASLVTAQANAVLVETPYAVQVM